MSRAVDIRAGGASFRAELVGDGEVRVDGTTFRVEAHGPDRVVLLDDEGRRHVVAVAGGANGDVWLFADGRPWRVEATLEGARPRRGGGDDATLAAPMPATVVAIPAPPGTPVSAGDPVIVLEAMKMELVIRAPRDGTVAAVHCRVGELVQPGPPLAEVAP